MKNPHPAEAKAKLAKVFWFFFSKKNKDKKTLLFEKRSKNFCLFGA